MPRDSRGAPLGPRVGDGSALGSRCRRWTASNPRPDLSFNHTNASFVERMVDTNLARRASRKTFNSPRALAQRFHEPWSGDVPPGESANPGGRAMAEETPKAPEPELTIGEEAKAPARPRNLYGYVKKAWRDHRGGVDQETYFQRMVEWRRGEAFVRIDRPTRVDRARGLGYRAKQGYAIVRARVRRGGRRRPKPMGGRHPKRRGLRKITMAKSIQRIAEERTARHYPNMEVLNSYWIGEDGMHKYYEVILVDPQHPVIRNDPKINWICEPGNRGRAFRGLTSAGKKGRGLLYKGKGAEKIRPSIGSHDRTGK